jgi:hypothetical protein
VTSGLSGVALADPFNMNSVGRGELVRLPEYCASVHGWGEGSPWAPSVQQQRWIGLMGPTFWHVHHYCWGMLKALRAESIDVKPQMRSDLYASAISEAHYVLERATADFKLLPEIHFKVGQYQVALQRWAEALESFDRSRAMKPDYWPAYIEIAKVNLRLRRRDHAVEILKRGLDVMPGETRLTDALRRINSDTPLPSGGIPSARTSARPTPAHGTEMPDGERAKKP